MFENFSNKIINFFKPKKRNTVSTKELGAITNDLDNILRYKNLIPNLLDEFIKPNISDYKRSNSLKSKNIKLTLSQHRLTRSNSGLLLKLKNKNNKKQSVRCSIGRHYFMGSIEESSKKMTAKNVRRGSFKEIKENVILEKKEEDLDNLKSKIDVPKKRKLKRKGTIDPQDTVEANNMEFFIGEEELELDETKEKLEEYQEKMRKTQLRYYVFKKITNYKSALRKCFHIYRSKVQLMGALDEKEEENKENNIENSLIRTKMLKNILKNRAFKEQKELTKYLLRFYYNCKYIAKITSLEGDMNLRENDNVDKNDENIINPIKEEKEEVKKEEEKKELTQEEIEMAQRKRNKELRDLFYNKIRERKKWLHDHFVKFYYKGLLWAMKTGNIRNNTSSSGETTTETTSNNEQSNTSSNENNPTNKTSSEIDTININKEIEKKEEEKKDEEPKPKKRAPNKMRDRSKGLRKLLSERNKEKTNILRKYFFKFLSNGILLSLKKTTLQSTKTLKGIEDPENEGKDEEKEKEENEKNWIIEEKKRRKQEEEEKQKELFEKRVKLILKIFNKKDKIQCGMERSCLQKWNLRAKIIAIADLTSDYKKPKKTKGKKKKKKIDGKNKEKKEEKVENEEKEEQ